MKTKSNYITDTVVLENNYNLLRLAAAFLVLVSHSFGILDKGREQPHVTVNGLFIVPSDMGLYIFFTISGYLVTQSLFTSRSYGHYLWKRFVRIIPALVVVNMACVLMGACISALPVREYFTDKTTWTYLVKNSTLIVNQFLLPGVFISLHDRSVNASIWTIILEVRFYIALLIAGMLSLLNRRWLLLSGFILFEAVAVYVSVTKLQVPSADLNIYFTFGTYFFLGVLYRCFRQVIFFSWRYAFLLLLIAVFTSRTWLQPVTMAVFISYSIIAIGNSKAIIRLKGWDISYGFYLYAFPVQQWLLFAMGYSVNVWLHILLSALITSLLAILSWLYVEKPALQKKNLFIIR